MRWLQLLLLIAVPLSGIRGSAPTLASIPKVDDDGSAIAKWTPGRVSSHWHSAAPPAPGTVARTPPMGWSSWNAFHGGINEAVITNVTDALVASGLRDTLGSVQNFGVGILSMLCMQPLF